MRMGFGELEKTDKSGMIMIRSKSRKCLSNIIFIFVDILRLYLGLNLTFDFVFVFEFFAVKFNKCL